MDDKLKEGNGVTKPISILFLADTRSYHTGRWLRFFAEKGFRIMLYDALNRPAGMEGVQIVQPGWKDDPQAPYPQRLAHILVDLGIKLREVKPDLLHTHFLVNWGWWGAFSGFHPLLTTIWGSDLNIGTYHSDFHRRANQISLWQSDVVTADSNDLLQRANELTGTDKKGELIYFGIDTDLFEPDRPTDDFRRKYDLESDQIILSPRNFLPNFNITILIEAFAAVVSRFPRARLILLSYQGMDPRYEEKVTELVGRLNLKEKVRRLHALPRGDMADLFNIARLTVSIPDHDGTACSVLESLACQTPVIVSRIASMEEWVGDGDVGFLVDQHDPVELAGKIKEILASPESDRSMGAKGRELVIRRGDVNTEWTKMARLYSQLAAAGRSSVTPDYPGSKIVQDYLAAAAAAITDGDAGRAREIYLALLQGLYKADPEKLEPILGA
ncbi:glycosyltransferase [candidate division KSB1 bacterium]